MSDSSSSNGTSPRGISSQAAYQIEVADEQAFVSVDVQRLREAVAVVLGLAEVRTASVSLAVVDDATIYRLNARYLAHDEPTDVLSFLLESAEGPDGLEGEIVVSAERANIEAPHHGWSADDELLLYVVHGALHLVGYDDRTPEDARKMYAREADMLVRLGAPTTGCRAVEPTSEGAART